MSGSDSAFPGYTKLPEPELRFNLGGLHKHPLAGLLEHGPYSLRLGVPGSVRLAVVARKADISRVAGLVRELNGFAKARQATNYYPDYPGFREVFRTPLTPPSDRTLFELPDELDRYAASGANQHNDHPAFMAELERARLDDGRFRGVKRNGSTSARSRRIRPGRTRP